jgi:hypothetical protein
MKCSNCGSIIEGEARFCPDCGLPLTAPTETLAAVPKPLPSKITGFDDPNENSGIRGQQQKGQTKFFYGKARYAHELAQVIERFLISNNLETQIIEADKELIIQGKQKPNVFKKALGLDQAATVGVSVEGNDIKVTIGGAKWIDKAAGAAIGWLIFWPALATAGWGAFKQKQLFSKIEIEIEHFLLAKEHENHEG